MRVAGGKTCARASSGFGSDAVGHADGAAAAVIAAGPQPTGAKAEVCVHDDAVEEVELGEVQGRGLFFCSRQAHEMVEDLGRGCPAEGGTEVAVPRLGPAEW